MALVGPSGAGKSTVFALLLRFYDPTSGRILVDGADLRSVTPDALRRRMAIVPQDVTIFAASIHDNIAFGTAGATRAQVMASSKAAQADEFIQRLPQAYDTLAGERGVTLSAGSASASRSPRAAEGRADPASRRGYLGARCRKRNAGAARAGWSDGKPHDHRHRPPAGDRAQGEPHSGDGRGRIVEEGTHAALIRQNGLYARLARLQFDHGQASLERSAANS